MASSVVTPPVGSSALARFLAEHNPFYILSAICMILGIFALSDSFDWSPKPAGDVLWLMVTLNVYEWSLIGLAGFLWRRGIYRDGIFLLVIEAFFLVDVGFLNMEIYTIDPVLGLFVNVALLVMSLAKLAVVFRMAHLPVFSRLYAFVALQLLALLAIPGLLADAALRNNGYLQPMTIYIAWWLVGLMPVLAIPLARSIRCAGEFSLLNRWGRVVAPAFIVLAFLSLAAHLALNHWVYKSMFALVDLSPAVLGLSVFVARWDALVPSRDRRRRFQVTLPILAIVLAALSPSWMLTFDVGFDVSPLRLTLLAAALVCVDGAVNFRQWHFGFLACGYLSAAGMGPTIPTMAQTGETRVVSMLSMLKMLAPKTSAHWGILGVVSAFAMLAVGAAISVLRSAARVTIGAVEPRVVEAVPPTPYDPPSGNGFPMDLPKREEGAR